MNTYRITARVPWGVEHYLVAAPNHLAAVARVEESAQPRGEEPPAVMAWELLKGETR